MGETKMVDEKKEVETKEENKELPKWVVDEVPTQTQPMVINTETKEAYPTEQAISVMLNTLSAIEEKINKLLQ